MTLGLGNADLEGRALALEEVLEVLDDVDRGILTVDDLRAEVERRRARYRGALREARGGRE